MGECEAALVLQTLNGYFNQPILIEAPGQGCSTITEASGAAGKGPAAGGSWSSAPLIPSLACMPSELRHLGGHAAAVCNGKEHERVGRQRLALPERPLQGAAAASGLKVTAYTHILVPAHQPLQLQARQRARRLGCRCCRSPRRLLEPHQHHAWGELDIAGPARGIGFGGGGGGAD